MSDPRTVAHLLAEAERAAGAGDLTAAEELLKEAAARQERELGPLHPDLANTLNNLAIIAEKTGRLDDAETFYRRAVTIASTSLAPDDPMVTASRQNLEDFCRANGRPIDPPVVIEPPAQETAPPPPPTLPRPIAPPLTTPAPTGPEPSRPVAERRSRTPAMVAIAAAAVVIVGLAIGRPWSSRPAPTTTVPAAETPSTPPPASAAEPSRSAPPPPAAAPKPAPPVERRAPAAAAAANEVVTAQLCRNFSTQNWRCDPVGDSTAPGPIVFYTRIRSPRAGVIVHRWYQGNTLRRSVQLRIGANAVEGYRTYSRQTVDRGEWRLELRSADGTLLQQRSLLVR